MSSAAIAEALTATIDQALETGESTYVPELDLLAVPDVKEAEIVANGEVGELTGGDLHRRPDGRTVRLFFGYRRRLRREVADVLVAAADLDGDGMRRLLMALVHLDDEELRSLAVDVVEMDNGERIEVVNKLMEAST